MLQILMSVHHLLVPMPENALISLMTLPVNVNLDGMEDFVMKVRTNQVFSLEICHHLIIIDRRCMN